MGAHTMYDEVDAEGRASGRRCVCNPDWNAFSHATLEHLCAVGDTLKAMNLKS